MKNIVVYMDEDGGCRVLVNPKDLSIYKNKSNAAINPNIVGMLTREIGPERWVVKDGELDYRRESRPVASSKVTTYVLTEKKSDVREILTKAAFMTLILIGMAIASR